MGKRGGLGFQERDAFKRKKRKEEEKGRLFLKGIRDYLFSDSYMYAPLLSPVPPHSTIQSRRPLSLPEVHFNILKDQLQQFLSGN